ncbi:hypothetical protein [Dysgonomonas capnocytophagoides]|uniref:hypothetical protein n=1 Tax=Dysgonomonas capnocytophagoides TaxID=45254 RepID=UPI00399449D7
MEKLEKGNLNLEPIYTFLTEDILPKDFSKLLDEFLYNYVMMLIQSQPDDRIGIHKDSAEFIYYLKLLRDILPLCDKK